MEIKLENAGVIEQTSTQTEALFLPISVTDPDVVVAIKEFEQGPERNRFVELALKIGVLSLRTAKGTLDGEQIKTSGEKLIAQLAERLQGHRDLIDHSLGETLRSYFDPNSGHFGARVQSLTSDDGELAQLVRRQVGAQAENLKTLMEGYVGANGQLTKLLGTGEDNQFVAHLTGLVTSMLEREREEICSQFSLDRDESALSRLVKELKLNHGDVSRALTERKTEVVGEFSLDKPDSALSRLVGRVDQAQRTITDEFSLDREDSALNRLQKQLLGRLEEGQRKNDEFQKDVLRELTALSSKRAAESKSTTHGHVFEENVGTLVANVCARQQDVFEATGSSTGMIKNSKVGDFVVTLSPENAAAGAKIVVEAKEDQSYTVKSTLEEADTARRNRSAGICVFVHSARTAPAGLETLSRFGRDIVCIWDSEDESSDVTVKAALMVAKAMSVKQAVQSGKEESGWKEIDRAIESMRKQLGNFTELKTWSDTIKGNAEKSLDRIRIMNKQLDSDLSTLGEQLEYLRTKDVEK